jgi:hypothetical protein
VNAIGISFFTVIRKQLEEKVFVRYGMNRGQSRHINNGEVLWCVCMVYSNDVDACMPCMC